MNRIDVLISKADKDYLMWLTISQDASLLTKHNKTQVEALCLASYFEGKRDAFLLTILPEEHSK